MSAPCKKSSDEQYRINKNWDHFLGLYRYSASLSFYLQPGTEVQDTEANDRIVAKTVSEDLTLLMERNTTSL